jgi:hypothetical protein
MIRCSLGYHKSKVDELPIFAIGVRDGIYTNALVFVTPPLLQIDFELIIQEYSAKRGAYENGGSAQKGPYQEAKQALTVALDTLSNYVNTIALGNENTILLSGFVPTKGYRSEIPAPVQPKGISLKRPGTGMILAECDNQKTATNYVCLVSANEPFPTDIVLNDSGQLVFWQGDFPTPTTTKPNPEDPANAEGEGPANTMQAGGYIDFSPSRKKEFKNLKSGVRYYFVFIAANSTGVSGFSDPVSIICG